MRCKHADVTLDAVQRHKFGDHPDVMPFFSTQVNEFAEHLLCGHGFWKHGYLRGSLVCPGDWILTPSHILASEAYLVNASVFRRLSYEVAKVEM